MADKKVMSNLDFQTTLKIKNLAAPSAASNDAARKVDVEAAYTAAISRANHTGTQLAATISDFDTQVRLSRLDQLAAPTASVSMNSQKIINQADPTNPQDSATKNYVDTQVSGLVSNQILKGAVVVASTVNVNLAAPGTTVDGVTLNNGEVFLATAQTTGTQNGPYVFNGSAVAATRALNWDTSAEAVLGSYWIVEKGSQADKFALMTNDTTITLGTTTPAFSFIGIATSIGRYETTSPVVTAGGSWVVNHALGQRSVTWDCYRTASPFDDVDVYGERTDANNLTLKPDVAMASGEYTVVVKY